MSSQAVQWLSIAAFVAISFAPIADGQPIAQWQFDETHFKDGVLRPTIGQWEGKALGAAGIGKEKPLALEANKEFRGIVLHEDISKAELPKGALSVTAWARIDKAIEWGGILGAIQDNGSFERGCIFWLTKVRTT